MRYTLILFLALCTLQLSAQKPAAQGAKTKNTQWSGAKPQNNKGGYKETKLTTPTGMQIDLFSKGGTTPKAGDFMSFHLLIKSGTDSILMSTYSTNSPTKGKPMEIQYSPSKTIADLMEAFQRLGVGDSAAVMVPSDSIFQGQLAAQRPPFFPQGSFMKYYIKMIGISDPTARIQQEKNAIAKFVKDSGLKVTTTASGLNYVVMRQGTGVQAKAGDEVIVHYSGRLLNGTEFDASYKRGEPFTFKLGQGQVIKGWDEGIALLKVGSKAKLIIPSELGYGAQGAGAQIPPNSPLVFDVELIGIKPPAGQDGGGMEQK